MSEGKNFGEHIFVTNPATGEKMPFPADKVQKLPAAVAEGADKSGLIIPQGKENRNDGVNISWLKSDARIGGQVPKRGEAWADPAESEDLDGLNFKDQESN